jgi:hypothetical protein
MKNKNENKNTFICDICGKEKSGRKFPVFDENWNKIDIIQCEDCFKEKCRCD